MAKLTRKQRETVSEAEVNKVLNKGGKSILKNRTDTDEPKKVQLRIYQDQIEEIDLVRGYRTGSRKVSRHAWIIEAIEEKLEREREEFAVS
ncbi:MAG: hypothetical protein KDJ52_32580 [Anaerolineae bacterium]|nr:hypothetical protein [Anaerolineae bacterium]